MRSPRLSTGAWIFATAALVLAVAAPVSYAAATASRVVIRDAGTTQTATIINSRLLTSPTWTQDQVAGSVALDDGCVPVYTPPAGDAVVVTSVTYDLGSVSGSDGYAVMTDNCSASASPAAYDIGDTSQAFDTFQHTFPAGLPLTGIAAIANHVTQSGIYFTGYLIPAGQLPPKSLIPRISGPRLAKFTTGR